MRAIRNPILPGFHPDPSILRVGDDFFIAVSTFQWFPGVRIYRSRDLAHWRLAAKPLDRVSQLDLSAAPESGGVWAPDLSWKDGLFHLVYTNTSRWSTAGGPFDTPNFLVTCDRVDGRWSDPVFLNASGFDPSLFHDEDGRSFLLNMIWDGRPGRNPFAGIVLQEYDSAARRLAGEARTIFPGTALGSTEGPHLYRRGGWYYLVTAEGGTSYDHAVTVARSCRIEGPYEAHPRNPILTSSDDPALPIQKAGHGSFVETQGSEWFLAHLGARPLSPRGRCTLGRETCLQRLQWTEDGWPELEGGGRHSLVEIPAPALDERPWPSAPGRDDFDTPSLSQDFDTLRGPLDAARCSLAERPGWLRLRGGASLRSMTGVSMVARRLTSFRARATTRIEFVPGNFQRSAGLVVYYDSSNHATVHITVEGDAARACASRCVGGAEEIFIGPELGRSVCELRAEIDRESLSFFFSIDGAAWQEVGPVMDASFLSDEACTGFTGAFVGLFAVDRANRSAVADFDFFEYEDRR